MSPSVFMVNTTAARWGQFCSGQRSPEASGQGPDREQRGSGRRGEKALKAKCTQTLCGPGSHRPLVTGEVTNGRPHRGPPRRPGSRLPVSVASVSCSESGKVPVVGPLLPQRRVSLSLTAEPGAGDVWGQWLRGPLQGALRVCGMLCFQTLLPRDLYGTHVHRRLGIVSEETCHLHPLTFRTRGL